MPTSRSRIVRMVWRLPAILLLCAVMGSGGCIVAAVVGAVALAVGMPVRHAVTVEVQNSPEEVYEAMLRVVEKNPELTLLSESLLKYKVEAFKLKNQTESTAVPMDGGKTRLTVKAAAGEKDQTDKELAIKTARDICAELGIKDPVIQNVGAFGITTPIEPDKPKDAGAPKPADPKDTTAPKPADPPPPSPTQ